LSHECARRLGPRANVVGMGSVRLKGLSEPVEVYAFRHS
jgi:class 3 adenylate cyclase